MRSEEWWWKRRGAAFRFMAMAGFVQAKRFLPAAGVRGDVVCLWWAVLLCHAAVRPPVAMETRSAAERIPREPLRGCSE